MAKTSTNKFKRKEPKVADKGWKGDNLHDAPLGFELPDGTPTGLLEPGGIGHYKNLDE